MIAEKEECDGSEKSLDYMSTIEECAKGCEAEASMFAFGTNDYGKNRCIEAGCMCLCETSASSDGTCNQVSHMGYRLYKYKPDGKALIYSNASYLN